MHAITTPYRDMVEPKCPNLYGVRHMPVQGLIGFCFLGYSDETLDRWIILITGASCNPCT